MKKLLLILIIVNISCSENKMEPDTAYVSGIAIENFRNKEIYLQYILNDSLITDTTMVKSNGKFKFEVKKVSYPVLALLTNDLTNHAPKVDPKAQFHSLFEFQFGSPAPPYHYLKEKDAKMFALEEGTVIIEITDSIYNSNVAGNSFNQQLKGFHNELNEVMRKYNRFKKEHGDFTIIEDKEKVLTLSQKYGEIWQERHIVYRDHILNNTDSLSSLFAIYYISNGVNSNVSSYYEMVNDTIKNSPYGSFINNRIITYNENLEKTLYVNDIMQNFVLKDRDGKEVALYDIKSKYILVEFWAAWCGPCRVENRAISKFYGNYDPKDFQMIGISVDEKKEEWIKAMEIDNVTWISLYDENKVLNNEMAITGLPTNFLMDQNFKIIDKQIKSERLKEKLDLFLK